MRIKGMDGITAQPYIGSRIRILLLRGDIRGILLEGYRALADVFPGGDLQ